MFTLNLPLISKLRLVETRVILGGPALFGGLGHPPFVCFPLNLQFSLLSGFKW